MSVPASSSANAMKSSYAVASKLRHAYSPLIDEATKMLSIYSP